MILHLIRSNILAVCVDSRLLPGPWESVDWCSSDDTEKNSGLDGFQKVDFEGNVIALFVDRVDDGDQSRVGNIELKRDLLPSVSAEAEPVKCDWNRESVPSLPKLKLYKMQLY
jgi:hypothetical protein